MLVATNFFIIANNSKIKDSPQLMEIVHGGTIKVSNRFLSSVTYRTWI